MQAGDNPIFAKPEPINPTPWNSHPTACTLQPTSYTLPPTPYTIHLNPYLCTLWGELTLNVQRQRVLQRGTSLTRLPGYLSRENPPPPRTLQYAHVWGPMVALGVRAVYYVHSTPCTWVTASTVKGCFRLGITPFPQNPIHQLLTCNHCREISGDDPIFAEPNPSNPDPGTLTQIGGGEVAGLCKGTSPIRKRLPLGPYSSLMP